MSKRAVIVRPAAGLALALSIATPVVAAAPAHASVVRQVAGGHDLGWPGDGGMGGPFKPVAWPGEIPGDLPGEGPADPDSSVGWPGEIPPENPGDSVLG